MPFNILAIDDEPTCLEIINFSLSAKGYKVYLVESGIEGINFLKNSNVKIDLILLDMMMPGICGLTTAKKIRENQVINDIPIILQTGASNYNEISEKSNLLGIDHVIVKPYNRYDLLEKVELALKEKQKLLDTN